MTVAELVSELCYAGKTLAEIAGYDDLQMRWVIARKRTQGGSLIRHPEGLPSWVEVDDNGMRIVKHPRHFATMFRQVKRFQGLEEDKIAECWEKYRLENPRLGVGGEDG